MATQTINGTEYTLRSSKRGTYVLYQGGAITPGDLQRLLATSRYSHGRKLQLSQGGLANGAVEASGGTHDWLGVYDVSIRDWSKDEVWQWCTVAMWNGIRPFPRGFTWDSFQGRTVSNIHDGNEHVHVLVGGIFPHGHPARYQQLEYDARGDGLVGNAAYTGPWLPVKGKLWAESPYNPANRDDTPRRFEVAVAKGSTLFGLDINRQPVITKAAGATVDAVAVVNRWGRQNALTKSGNYYAVQYLKPAA